MTKDISLKAACADTFHYPADWDPTQGSLDAFQRRRGFEHHFGRQRTRNLHKGILQIRFEMPFKVQCLRCETYIGQGTRYDADKKKVGNYFSSPIYEFEMRCGVVVGHKKSADGRIYCNEKFVIRTDAKNDDYELAAGLRRKVETWDPKATETIELADPETQRKMQSDPMFKVEQTIRNTTKEKSDKERLRELHDLQLDREDAYALNSVLRKAHRQKRKEIEAEEEAIRQAGPQNFCLPLQPASADDAREAASVKFRTDLDKVEVSVRRAAIRAAPLFRGGVEDAGQSPSSSSSSRGLGAAMQEALTADAASATAATTTTATTKATRTTLSTVLTRSSGRQHSLGEVSTAATQSSSLKRKRGSDAQPAAAALCDSKSNSNSKGDCCKGGALDVDDDEDRSRRLDILLRGSSNNNNKSSSNRSSSRCGLVSLVGGSGGAQTHRQKSENLLTQRAKASQQVQELVAKRRRLAQHALMAKAFG